MLKTSNLLDQTTAAALCPKSTKLEAALASLLLMNPLESTASLHRLTLCRAIRTFAYARALITFVALDALVIYTLIS